MKKILFLVLLFTALVQGQNPTRNIAGFGAGFSTNDMAASSIFEARSTTKGVLFPRMSETQRDAIVSPAAYLLVVNTTTGKYNYFDGSDWVEFGGGSTPDLQEVLTEGNESTTQDAIFRLDADKYLKINRADQVIEFWDLTINVGDPIGQYKINQVYLDGGFDGAFLEPNSLNLYSSGYSLIISSDKITLNGVDYLLPTGTSSPLATLAIAKTANFTAELNQIYTNNGTITVTDPTSATNKGYIVYVLSGTSTIGGVGYTTGALVYRYYNGSTWVSKDFGAGGGATNLGYTPSPTDGIVTSDTGTDATLPLADGTNAGLLKPAKYTVLENTSGTNSGDNSANTNSNAYADAKVTDAIADGVTTIAPSQNAVFDALELKQKKVSIMTQASAYALTNTTSLQKAFNVGSGGAGAFNPDVNKAYYFKALLNFTGLPNTSSTISFGFAGTATITTTYTALGAKASTLSGGNAPNIYVIQTTASSVVAASSAATGGRVIIDGIIRCTGAGTVIPSVAFSVAGASMQAEIDNFVMFEELGANNITATSDMN